MSVLAVQWPKWIWERKYAWPGVLALPDTSQRAVNLLIFRMHTRWVFVLSSHVRAFSLMGSQPTQRISMEFPRQTSPESILIQLLKILWANVWLWFQELILDSCSRLKPSRHRQYVFPASNELIDWCKGKSDKSVERWSENSYLWNWWW